MDQNIPLACPIDGLPLELSGRQLACGQGHTYDLARAGYVNLLPVQFKSSKAPGDTKDMVMARRKVLESGLFQPVAQMVAERAGACAKAVPDTAPLLVDAGCGDGYYTNYIAEYLRAETDTEMVRVLGLDISKWAVTAASKRYKQIAWAVATNKKMPVVRGAAGIITSLFGFETWTPWAALQTSGQWVITVDAGPQHLIELRERIYDVVHVHDAPSDADAISAGYQKTWENRLTFAHRAVSADTITAILDMTPHGYKVSPAKRCEITQTDHMPLSIDAVIRVYQRH